MLGGGCACDNKAAQPPLAGNNDSFSADGSCGIRLRDNARNLQSLHSVLARSERVVMGTMFWKHVAAGISLFDPPAAGAANNVMRKVVDVLQSYH